MIQKNIRHPLRHFFVKKSIQIKFTFKILLVVMLAAVITTITLSLIYNNKSRSGSFYYMSNDMRQDLELKSILEFVLPSVISAQLFSIVIGLGIGLFSSRKMAVPIYKFEKWVSQLKKGNLNTKISFRETEEMEDLTVECNDMAGYYRSIFRDIDKITTGLEKISEENPAVWEQVQQLKEALDKVNYGERIAE
jgi:methyl-accepting chemotaxis protein